MNHFSSVLFDLDGTLSASAEGITRSLALALEAFGIRETSQAVLESFIGPPLNVRLQEVYHVSDDEAIAIIGAFRARYETIGYKECHPYPKVQSMLETLSDEGLTLAVASSKPEPSVLKILALFSLTPLFSVICGSAAEDEAKGTATANQKSSIIKRTLSLLEASQKKSPRPALMVGDRFYDIDGAMHNHIASAGVTWGYGTRDEFSKATFIADTPDELLSFITGKKESPAL